MNGAVDWNRYSGWRSASQLPLRPDARIAQHLKELVGPLRQHLLVLGMTPEICHVAGRVTVAEWNEQVIARSSPQDHPDARVVCVDWRVMDFPAASFDGAIGDGSLSVLRWPDDYSVLFARLGEYLMPGSLLAIRCYVAPDQPEPLEAVIADAMAGRIATFQALKWRVAMAIAADHGGNLPVKQILAAFDACFADRDALTRAAGWARSAIDEIDGYAAMGDVTYSFVTRAMIRETVPAPFGDVRFASSGDYPLSDRCPFLVAELSR